MPTCRHCNSTYSREYFIHGNGPRAQVCVRCGVEKGLVTPEEAPTLYSDELMQARMSVVFRRWGPAIALVLGWMLWLGILKGMQPWSAYIFVLLAIATPALAVVMVLYRAKYNSDMARLTPDYQRPKGH